MRPALRLVGLVASLLLAACAGPGVRQDQDADRAQAVRERLLADQGAWSLQGRLAISGKGESGSGTLDWQQDGQSFRFTLMAPVSGKVWTLAGNDSHVELSGLRAEPIFGADPVRLLERELGMTLPLEQLSYWVRGVRAPGQATSRYREDGLPLEFRQAGWTIEYRDYFSELSPPLPRKVFASKGELKVRLAIRAWNAGTGDGQP